MYVLEFVTRILCIFIWVVKFCHMTPPPHFDFFNHNSNGGGVVNNTYYEIALVKTGTWYK